MSGLLFVAPALALALLMALRRYPGERRLIAIASRRRCALPRAPRRVRGSTLRLRVTMRPRGGVLIALSLATRPPPALPA